MSTTSSVSSGPYAPAGSFASPVAVTGSTESRKQNRLPVLYVSSVLLSLIALAISGYLTYVAFTSSKILGCGGGTFDCEHVLNSKWSTLLGLPVAAWASALYLSVVATLAVTARPAIAAVPSVMRSLSWSVVTAAGVSAGLAALWFIGLQVFTLKHLCPWCLGAHSCGILLCITTLAMSPLAGRLRALCAGLGFIGAATLITIQVATPAPPTYVVEEFPTPSVQTSEGSSVIEQPEMFDAPTEGDDVFAAPGSDSSAMLNRQFEHAARDWVRGSAGLLIHPAFLFTAQVGSPAQGGLGGPDQQQQNQQQQNQSQNQQQPQAASASGEERLVHVASANVKLRPEQWPIIGSPNAKHIFVELFDYTCPHCRATQQAIHGARSKYGKDLAVIVLAVPLSRACNDTVTNEHVSHRDSCELAKYSIAVWKVAPGKFEEYHEWLLSVQPVPSAAVAKNKAAQLIGQEALEKELAQPNAARFISKHVEIYRKMGAGPIPKLAFSNTVLTGEMRSADQLANTIERQPR